MVQGEATEASATEAQEPPGASQKRQNALQIENFPLAGQATRRKEKALRGQGADYVLKEVLTNTIFSPLRHDLRQRAQAGLVRHGAD